MQLKKEKRRNGVLKEIQLQLRTDVIENTVKLVAFPVVCVVQELPFGNILTP